jgi:hypothetical protein
VQVFSFKHPSATELDTIFCGARRRASPNGGALASSTAPTTRRCSSSACIRRSCAAKAFPAAATLIEVMAGTVRVDRQFRTPSRAQRHAHRQDISPRIEVRAEAPLPRAHRRSEQELEVRRRRHQGATEMAAYMRAYESCLGATSSRRHHGTWYPR